MRRFAIVAAVSGALLAAGCSTGPSDAELLRAAGESCPNGLRSIEFSEDGTQQIDSVECEPSQPAKKRGKS